MKNFKGLDVVRTLLALAVATGHYYWVNGVPTFYPRSFFLAVDFFFILSGFVLSQSIMADRSKGLLDFTTTFFAKRLFRLYPLYLVLAAIWFFIAAYRGSVFHWYEYLNSLFLMQGIGVAGPDFVAQKTFSIAWTISVELWVGLLFFPFVFLLRKNIGSLTIICVSTAAISWALLFAYSPSYMDVTIHRLHDVVAYGVLRGLMGFALGTLCYLAFSRFRLRSLHVTTVAELVLLISYGLLFCLPNHSRSLEFAAPVFLAAILFILATEKGAIGSALTSDSLAFARPLSYSIYLLHALLIEVYRWQGIEFTNAGLPIFLCSVVLIAIPLYRYIERPTVKIGRDILRRKASGNSCVPLEPNSQS